MPRIFDNIQDELLTALRGTLAGAKGADFCVGYLNLRGWRLIREDIDQLPGEPACRLLIGMNPSPREELRQFFSLRARRPVDMQQVMRRKREIVQHFRDQLTYGAPTNEDERGLRDFAKQLRAGKVAVKLFLRYPLHAKLYLAHKKDYNSPVVAFLGSSNLSLAGLKSQGELNAEISDYDACQKLSQWFEERWNDKFCLDITADLIDVIDTSWTRKVSPYELYLKMAFHLSREARAGVNEFKLPPEIRKQLFDYQATAVQIAARHLNARGGVLLGDVVGLGKTLMATALARIFQDDQAWSALVICPPNLMPMWQAYVDEYGLRAKVLSLGKLIDQLPELRRYHIVIIDESHNLRNRDGKRYRALRDYIDRNDSRCVMLSATPYNRSYLDLSAQLRLFIPEVKDLGVKPERYLKTIAAAEFQARFQAHPRSLIAFEKSEFHDDWRLLMKNYMVRRTRRFIEKNYASADPDTGQLQLTLPNGERYPIPERAPRTIRLPASDQYRQLYSTQVVDLVNDLSLPRYGLGQYIDAEAAETASAAEKRQIDNLSRAGKRLMGFCRTNLFKRLESSGSAFLLSVERHIARNQVFLHALENDLPLPIGSLDAHILDPDAQDEDADSSFVALRLDDETIADSAADDPGEPLDERGLRRPRAEAAYATFSGRHRGRFKWLRAELFRGELAEALGDDIDRLSKALRICGAWDADQDTKLGALRKLIMETHKREKLLVFTQFADTARYLRDELSRQGVQEIEAATGQHANPTSLARRFSPASNGVKRKLPDEIRVLLSTDVLSEGQNLQDCAIVINYDLPWAIIRLSQRAGRVDRIGQLAPRILCYSFLPEEGVEAIIRLRARVRQRLRENGEVVGSDERFFEDEREGQDLRDLYTEKSAPLRLETDSDVDPASEAFEIWTSATKDDPKLRERIESLPDVVYSTRRYGGTDDAPQGVITYARSGAGEDALVWLDEHGEIVTESQLAILQAAKCEPEEPRRRRHRLHHRLARQGLERTQQEDYLARAGGQLDRIRGRAFDRLSAFLKDLPLMQEREGLEEAIDALYRYPLQEGARDKIRRQLHADISDDDLALLVAGLWSDDQLSSKGSAAAADEPQILCSLGMFD